MVDRRLDRPAANDGGVSEAIGFILIFSLVITGIGLVTLYGYPVLLKQQMGTDVRLMEKTMIVLQNDIKSLAFKNVPFKETSLKISGGSLSSLDSSQTPQIFSLSVDGISMYPDFSPGELRYQAELGDSIISLENGAVLTRNRDIEGSAMLARPRWFYDTETGIFVITLIQLKTDTPATRNGVGTVQLQNSETRYTEINITPGETATIEYIPDPENDYAVAWDQYFVLDLGLSPAGGNSYSVPAGTQKIVVKEQTITIIGI